MKYVLAGVVVGLMAAGASAAVVVGGTETFTSGVNGGADWGVGGASAYDGWQVDIYKNWKGEQLGEGGHNTHREFFGSTGQIFTTFEGVNSKGQLDPGSHSGAPGTLAVQHLAKWTGATGAVDDPDPAATCVQMKYITFTSQVGVTYELSAWVNTVYCKVSPDWDVDKKHPKVVNHNNPTMSSQFPDIQIGLKYGTADLSDLDTLYTRVTNLVDNTNNDGTLNPNAWVQTPTVTLVGNGGPMTILLKVGLPDISSGSGIDPADGKVIDADVRFDDITLTPEPTALVLLSLGLFLVRRR